jgi:hypothetical protein
MRSMVWFFASTWFAVLSFLGAISLPGFKSSSRNVAGNFRVSISFGNQYSSGSNSVVCERSASLTTQSLSLAVVR